MPDTQSKVPPVEGNIPPAVQKWGKALNEDYQKPCNSFRDRAYNFHRSLFPLWQHSCGWRATANAGLPTLSVPIRNTCCPGKEDFSQKQESPCIKKSDHQPMKGGDAEEEWRLCNDSPESRERHGKDGWKPMKNPDNNRFPPAGHGKRCRNMRAVQMIAVPICSRNMTAMYPDMRNILPNMAGITKIMKCSDGKSHSWSVLLHVLILCSFFTPLFFILYSIIDFILWFTSL